MPISQNGKEHSMTNLHQLMYLGISIALLAAFVISAVNEHKARRQRDFTRSLETLLQPKETIKVICPQRDFRCVLTNNRIIFEKKGDFYAFPIKSITKAQGVNEKGNRTTVPAKMVSFTIQIDKDYTLKNNCPEFADLVSQLAVKVKKQKKSG